MARGGQLRIAVCPIHRQGRPYQRCSSKCEQDASNNPFARCIKTTRGGRLSLIHLSQSFRQMHWRHATRSSPDELVAQLRASEAVAGQLVQSFSDSWTRFDRTRETITEYMRRSLDVPAHATVPTIDEKADRVLDAISAIRKALVAADLFYHPLQDKFNVACTAFTFGMRTLHNETIAIVRMSNPDPTEDLPSFVNLVKRPTPTDVADQQDRDRDHGKSNKTSTPFQQLVCYVLDCLWEYGYRRVGETLFEEIVTEEGHPTHAWCEKMTLKDFVSQVCSREKAPDMWTLLTASKTDNLDQIVRYVKTCVDRECLELKPNREIIAFRNALYYTGMDMVFYYEDRARWAQLVEDEIAHREADVYDIEMPNGGVQRVNRNYGKVFERPAVPSRNDVAMKYHNVDVPRDLPELPTEIETPEVERVLDSQNFDEDTKNWLYAFLGRCLHEVGLNGRDQWQVIPFIKGVAGCGKSTLLNLLRKIFPKHLVAAMSANAEEKFAWSAACDVYLWMCTEVRHKCSWAQGEFQSIVSGEDVPIAAKYQQPRTVAWSTPGILAGNEVFDLNDAAGSIRRRILVWECNNPVPPDASDPLLGAKAEANLGVFVVKINRMYLYTSFLYGQRDIWSKGVLPAALHSYKDKLKHAIDPVAHFMHERKGQRIDDFWSAVCREKAKYRAGEISKPDLHALSKSYVMKLGDFTDRYVSFRKQKGHKEMRISGTDHFKLVFAESRFMFFRERAREDEFGDGNFQVNDYLMGLRGV